MEWGWQLDTKETKGEWLVGNGKVESAQQALPLNPGQVESATKALPLNPSAWEVEVDFECKFKDPLPPSENQTWKAAEVL